MISSISKICWFSLSNMLIEIKLRAYIHKGKCTYVFVSVYVCMFLRKKRNVIATGEIWKRKALVFSLSLPQKKKVATNGLKLRAIGVGGQEKLLWGAGQRRNAEKL